jgi:hypothetical protein
LFVAETPQEIERLIEIFPDLESRLNYCRILYW